jgi:hypothetical protein
MASEPTQSIALRPANSGVWGVLILRKMTMMVKAIPWNGILM